MSPQRFGGAQMALDTMAGLEEKRRVGEQQEVSTVMQMAKIDPKGAANAWNRSYLGVKFGPITYTGSKGEWAGYKDGSGKLYALNRSTGEFKDGIGEGAPSTGSSLFDRQTPTVQGDIITDLGRVPTSDQETEKSMEQIGIKKADVKAHTAASAEVARVRRLSEYDRDDVYAADQGLKDAAASLGYESFDDVPEEKRALLIREVEIGRQRDVRGLSGKIVESPARYSSFESGIPAAPAQLSGGQEAPARIKVVITAGPEKDQRFEMDAKDFDPSWMKKL